MRAVIADPCGQHFCFPGARRAGKALQLPEYFGHRLWPAQAFVRRHVLPIEQEAHEVLQADRLDLPAQALDRVAMNPRQQVPLAPLQ
ncbi:hypothetical protein D3C78_1646900 [compost metagenome]